MIENSQREKVVSYGSQSKRRSPRLSKINTSIVICCDKSEIIIIIIINTSIPSGSHLPRIKKIIIIMSVVFFNGIARSHMRMSEIYLHGREIDYNGGDVLVTLS